MRLGVRLPLAAGFGLALAACVDLFHATNFETACDVDAAACELADVVVCSDPPDASPIAARDACAPPRAEAGAD